MPWKAHKRSCRQKSTGQQGTHAVVKIADDASEEQVSCHTSEKKANSAMNARHANECLIREYIRLQIQSLQY